MDKIKDIDIFITDRVSLSLKKLLGGILVVLFLLTIAAFIITIPDGWKDPRFVSLSLCLLLLGLFRNVSKGLFSSFLVFSFLYILTELIAYILVCQGILKYDMGDYNLNLGIPVIPYFNEESAKYDPNIGYRWLPGGHRTMKIANGKLVFDNYFKVNRQGFVSSVNYEYVKPDTSKARFLILGDSFTDAYYLKTPWPEALNKIDWPVNHQFQGSQFYSFAQNGSGISNWHNVFFKEIISKGYDFDNLMIAVFANDLKRDYFIMNHQKGLAQFGWVEELETGQDSIRNLLNNLDGLPALLSDSLLDLQKKSLTVVHGTRFKLKKWNLYAVTIFSKLVTKFLKLRKDRHQIGMMFSEFIYPGSKEFVSEQFLNQKYSVRNMQKLDSILSYCKTRHKDVYLLAIPESWGVELNRKNRVTQIQKELNYLSEKYSTYYFDGYEAFADIDSLNTENLFLPFDGHWSQQGSDLFAAQLEQYLLKIKSN